jgi:hypothetical protein
VCSNAFDVSIATLKIPDNSASEIFTCTKQLPGICGSVTVEIITRGAADTEVLKIPFTRVLLPRRLCQIEDPGGAQDTQSVTHPVQYRRLQLIRTQWPVPAQYLKLVCGMAAVNSGLPDELE